MKIHSSSLTFSPAQLNQQQIAKNNSAKNDKRTELPATQETLPPLRVYPPDKISKASEAAGLNLDSAKQQNVYTPSDKRTLNAINAYQLEINKTLQNQRANSIIGVDTYA
ncbi:MAG: hypothetical protein Q8N96_03545 [Methylovulum sp.]|nr:hypothetical protein [Methylovulum sp.]